MKIISAKMKWWIPIVIACSLACAKKVKPPSLAVGKTVVNVPAPTAEIDEIVLERFGHRPSAPFYKVVLRKDGTVSYTGEFNVTKVGTFTARINPREFHRLGELIDHLSYFEMKDSFFVPLDADCVRTTVAKGGQRKTTDNGSGSDAPEELWAIEMVIDGLVAGITDWMPTK